MTRYRDRPIRQKLAIITIATIAMALLLAGIGNLLADSVLFRRSLRGDLTVLVRVIADNSTAALAFNDPEAAAQILGALKERTHIVGACIYRNSVAGGADVFAHYTPTGNFSCPPSDGANGPRFTPSDLAIAEPILLNGRRIGTLALIYDLGELNDRLRLYGSLVFGVFLGATLVAFLFSARLREAIAAPIARLVHATRVAETGDYSVRAEKLSGDELGVLVDRFNEMLAAIQSRDGALNKALADVERERARFQFTSESIPQKIFTATREGSVDYVNGQWLEYSGYTFEQIRDSGWTRIVHPDDVEANVREWRRSMETGEPFHFQQRFRRVDGAYRWHLSRALAMRDAEGTVTMWLGSNTDIHEQKEKEEELRRANEDLRQFAYSASHDLQEPIRNVAVFSEIIAHRYEGVLDEDGRQFLGFLMEGGQRLARLVNDLLAYTRTSLEEVSETRVEPSEVLRSALASLSGVIEESAAVITSDELPPVHMSALHLQQLFQNLIGNAVKYRSDETPQIHISVIDAGSMWRFAVRDNGIGIDSQYKEKIFGLFKRLSHDRVYGGTGIGLAICQRVVERYGGRIWVESEPGKGSTFYFTIPREYGALRHAAA